MTKSQYKLSLLGVASTFAMTLALAGPAAAQEQVIEEIVVTGTRLPTGYTSPTPTTTMTAADIATQAPNQILDVLYDIPAFKTDSGVAQGQRTSGSLTVATTNLRGLGAVRTLTLVNGRRQVGLADQTYDTNRIPTNLVERVEVVTGGASAAYGSDAVAGVVNFIINDRLEGVRLNAQTGVSQRNDNKQYSASFAYGKSFANDRGHFIFGSDYANSLGTDTMYARAYGRAEPGVVSPNAAQRAAQGLPANLYVLGVEFLATGTPGGIITSGPLAGTAFTNNGTPYAFQIGQQIGSPASGLAFTNFQLGATSNYGQTTVGTVWLNQPLERSSNMARVTFDITPDLTAFADWSYTWAQSSGQSGNQNLPNGIQSSFIIQSSNPYIPTATRAAMASAGITQFTLGYLPVAISGNRVNTALITDNDGYVSQFNTGLRGKLGESWGWDATFSHGWLHNYYRGPNNLYTPNFTAATYVVNDANGRPVCGPLETNPNLNATTRALVRPGCVPYNPFGLDAPSTEAITYVTASNHSLTKTRQDTFAFNMNGSPVDLWAGPLAVAFGFEFRKDKLQVTGDDFDSRGITANGTTTYGGKQSVKEGYVEVGVPLVKDVALVKSLDFNSAVRRTDYELSGAVTTYKAGLTWDVNDALRIRATQSRDIRAPNLLELFRVGAQGTNQAIRNPFTGVTNNLLVRPTGNASLKPEIAQTFTGGFVLRPTGGWASRFALTADYYDIKVKGVIAALTGSETLQRCFTGSQDSCGRIVFDTSSYGVAYVNTTTFNLNVLRAEGLDIDLSYDAPIDAINVPGRLRVHALGSYQPTLTTTDSSGISTNRAGTAQGVPEWRWVVNFDYRLAKFSGQLQANIFNESLSDPNLIGPDDSRYAAIVTTASNTINKNLFPGGIYLNMSAQYDLSDNVQIFGNISNLLDKQPPALAMIAFSGTGGQYMPYDLIGRMFKVGVRATF